MQKSYDIIPLVNTMDRNNIEKIAKTSDEKILLAKIWDKIQSGLRRNIPANTGFLSQREQEMTQYLFGNSDGLVYFGGYPEAERKMLVYLPEYMDEAALIRDDSPVACLRATFYEEYALSHRDFLGALMGVGIARETVGDICVGTGLCDFFVTAEISPYVLQNFSSSGRVKLQLKQINFSELELSEPVTKEIRDTLASMRLDSVISSGFRISRGLSNQYITAGKVTVNCVNCEKPDRLIAEGDKISLRGFGKICLKLVNGQTKKGRISVVIDRYV